MSHSVVVRTKCDSVNVVPNTADLIKEYVSLLSFMFMLLSHL